MGGILFVALLITMLSKEWTYHDIDTTQQKQLVSIVCFSYSFLLNLTILNTTLSAFSYIRGNFIQKARTQ